MDVGPADGDALAPGQVDGWSCLLAYPEGWLEVPLGPGHLDLDDPDALRRSVADRFGTTADGTGRSGAGADDDPRGLSPADGAERRGRASDGDVDDDSALVELVVAVLAHDVSRGAVLGAHRHVDDPQYGHVHAHLTMWVLERRHPGSLAEELVGLVERSRRPEGAVEEPEVDEVSLPAGRALRVRFLAAEQVAPAGQEADADAGPDAEGDDPWGGGRGIDGGDGSDGADVDAGANRDDIYAVLVDTVNYLVPVYDTGYCLWLRFWTPHLALAEQLVGEFDSIAQALVVDHPGARASTLGG